MRLFYAPNTISIAVAIALHEAGLDYTPRRVDFAAGEQTTPEYHAINPKGRVPALETDGDLLTETGAILEYIAALAPETGLFPADPRQAAHVRSVMYYLASTMHVNHAHMRRGHRWANAQSSFEDMAAKTPQTMTESCVFVEENALRGRFVLGERLSMADPYLFVVCTWLEGDGVDVSPFPKITAFRDAMRARASVKRAQDLGML